MAQQSSGSESESSMSTPTAALRLRRQEVEVCCEDSLVVLEDNGVALDGAGVGWWSPRQAVAASSSASPTSLAAGIQPQAAEWVNPYHPFPPQPFPPGQIGLPPPVPLIPTSPASSNDKNDLSPTQPTQRDDHDDSDGLLNSQPPETLQTDAAVEDSFQFYSNEEILLELIEEAEQAAGDAKTAADLAWYQSDRARDLARSASDKVAQVRAKAIEIAQAKRSRIDDSKRSSQTKTNKNQAVVSDHRERSRTDDSKSRRRTEVGESVCLVRSSRLLHNKNNNMDIHLNINTKYSGNQTLNDIGNQTRK